MLYAILFDENNLSYQDLKIILFIHKIFEFDCFSNLTVKIVTRCKGDCNQIKSKSLEDTKQIVNRHQADQILVEKTWYRVKSKNSDPKCVKEDTNAWYVTNAKKAKVKF